MRAAGDRRHPPDETGCLPKSIGRRHAGPGHGHAPVPTGHVNGNPTRHRLAAKKTFLADSAGIETGLHGAMVDVFDRQEKRVLSGLKGSRGRKVRRAAKRADDGGQTPEQPQQPQQPVPDAAAIFDIAWAADQTAKAVQPSVDQAAQAGPARVAAQLGVEPPTADSLDAVHQVLAQRSNRLAGQVTQTTFAQIQQALSDGVADGDSIPQLTDRIRHVFQVARTRAALIARTETCGALNEAAHTYAMSLPAGTVGSKEWLAHHDQRTRMTHRVADGQQRPLAMPFAVGTSLMQHPGDPLAPPDETCNCRCSALYLPGPNLRPVTPASQIGEAA